MRTRLLTALTATTLLATPAAASAQGAAPTPGCHGIQITDKAGDSANALDPSQTGSPSSDLVAGWITYDGGKAFANIQVVNLTEGEVDDPYVAVSWQMTMTTTAGPRLLRAYHDRLGMTKYSWGEPRAITDDQTAPRVGGATTGTLFPGPNGVIQIELPLAEADFGAKPGTVLKGLGLEVRQWLSIPAGVPSTGLPIFSVAPIYDQASGKGAFTLGPCPATPAPGAPGGGGPAAPAPVESAPGRVAPQLSFSVKPGRDKKPPFAFRTVGKLIPPSGVSRSDACHGRVSVQVKNGKKTISNRRAQVRPDCTFVDFLKVKNRKRVGKGKKLRFIVTFQGNKVLLPQKAKARSVRVR